MKLSLFLGAGASVPLGFFHTKGFKTHLESLFVDEQNKDIPSMLQKSGFEDIETVLTAIEMLMTQQHDHAYRLLNNTVNLIYQDTNVHSDSQLRSLDEIISHFSAHKEKIQNQVYKAYAWNNRQVDLTLYDSVVQILRMSSDGIHICTTNYDQVMEHYIDENKELIRVDGFDHDGSIRRMIFKPNIFSDSRQNSNRSNSKKCYLYKLHGSLNWAVDNNGNIIQYESEEKDENESNFVIYPTLLSKNNVRKNEPYKTIWKKFQERIRKTDIFIVIGYSFRDDHINTEFKKFLRRSKTKLFVISPTAENDTSEKFNSEEFNHTSLNVNDPKQREMIQLYHNLCNSWNKSDILERDKLKMELQEIMPDFYDYGIKIYNLVNTIEDVNNFELFDMLRIIFQIQSDAKN